MSYTFQSDTHAGDGSIAFDNIAINAKERSEPILIQTDPGTLVFYVRKDFIFIFEFWEEAAYFYVNFVASLNFQNVKHLQFLPFKDLSNNEIAGIFLWDINSF